MKNYLTSMYFRIFTNNILSKTLYKTEDRKQINNQYKMKKQNKGDTQPK